MRRLNVVMRAILDHQAQVRSSITANSVWRTFPISFMEILRSVVNYGAKEFYQMAVGTRS